MFYSIDYYAFTIPTRSSFTEIGQETLLYCLNAFTSYLQLSDDIWTRVGTWGIERGNDTYSFRLRHSVVDVTISGGPANAHLYVELDGKACNNLDAKGELNEWIRKTADRTSRVDFAIDLETDADPRDFVALRSGKSFKSSGNKRTPSGRTEYLGGRTSERMARVYRYEPPHPRAALLRVEAEYKGRAAKSAIQHFLSEGLEQTCLDAHTPFGWQHPAWAQGDRISRKISYKAYNPNNASTVRWLYGDVVTALLKATKAGLIDFEEWLEIVREGLK